MHNSKRVFPITTVVSRQGSETRVNVTSPISFQSKQRSPRLVGETRSTTILSSVNCPKVNHHKGTTISQIPSLCQPRALTSLQKAVNLSKTQMKNRKSQRLTCHTVKNSAMPLSNFSQNQAQTTFTSSFHQCPVASSDRVNEKLQRNTSKATHQKIGANQSRHAHNMSLMRSARLLNFSKSPLKQNPTQSMSNKRGVFTANRLSVNISQFNSQTPSKSRKNMRVTKDSKYKSGSHSKIRLSFNTNQSSSINKTTTNKATPVRTTQTNCNPNQASQNGFVFKLNLGKIGLGKDYAFRKNSNAPLVTKNWPATEPETQVVASETTSLQREVYQNPTMLTSARQDKVQLSNVSQLFSERVSPQYRTFDNRAGQQRQSQQKIVADQRSCLISCPKLDKPQFAQVSSREVNETLVQSWRETSSEENAATTSPVSPITVYEKHQDRNKQFELKSLISNAGQEQKNNKSTFSLAFQNLSSKKSNPKQQSWQKGYLSQQSRLQPQMTKSSEELKFSNKAFQIPQNTNTAQVRSPKQLSICKNYQSIPISNKLKDLQKLLAQTQEPNLKVFDDKSSQEMRKSDLEASWNLISSSGGSLSYGASDVAEEDFQNHSSLIIKKQKTVKTMTRQNQRQVQQLPQTSGYKTLRNSEIKCSKEAQDFEENIFTNPSFSLRKNAQCTQSYADMIANNHSTMWLGNRTHPGAKQERQILSMASDSNKISTDPTEPVQPGFVSQKDQKPFQMFMTPKVTASGTPIKKLLMSPYLANSNARKNKPCFKDKLTLQTTASMPILEYDSHADQATQYSIDQNNNAYMTDSPKKSKGPLTKEDNVSRFMQIQDASKQISEQTLGSLEQFKSGAKTSTSKRTHRPIKQFSQNTQKTVDMNIHLIDQSPSLKSAHPLQASVTEQNFILFPITADAREKSNKFVRKTHLSAVQPNKDIIDRNEEISDHYYKGINIKETASKQERVKTINAFLQRQKIQENERIENIKSMKEKKFQAEMQSDALSSGQIKNKTERSLNRGIQGSKISNSDMDVMSYGANSDRANVKISFVKRMKDDIQKRNEKHRYLSPNVRNRSIPKGEIFLKSPLSPKKQQNTPQCSDDSQLFSGSSMKNGPSSVRSTFSLSRLMSPIGNFSTSMKKQIEASQVTTKSNSKITKALNNGFTRSCDDRSETEACTTTKQMYQNSNLAIKLELSQIQSSLLAQSRKQIKPGKNLNDLIMLEKLEQQLKPLKLKASQSIRLLNRQDFREMLFELNMLQRPTPSKRDEQDAQDFLDILFSQSESQQPDTESDCDAVSSQRHNQERMKVFEALVKSLLLLFHKSDTTLLDGVQNPDRVALLIRINDDLAYQEWLADQFFVFYLNRTQNQSQQDDQIRSNAEQNALLQLHLRKLSSLSSRYMSDQKENNNLQDEQSLSDTLDRQFDGKFLHLPQTQEKNSTRRPRHLRQLQSLYINGLPKQLSQEPKRQVRSLRRQKKHAANLINFGQQIKRDREELRLRKEEEEFQAVVQYHADRKIEMARYPWMEDEMVERKAECCERLHVDALRRLGLPLPEFYSDVVSLDLLDAKLKVPSIYQAIQQGKHAPFETFKTTQSAIDSRNLQEFLKKHSGHRVPKDELAGFESEYLSDESTFGNLPVLTIDLIAEELVKDGYQRDYPCLTLYEDDLFTDRVLEYNSQWPLSDFALLNLLEHIVFKLKQLDYLF